VIVFTPREYRMLVPLLELMGQSVPFDALMDDPFDIQIDRDLFRIHMARVRKKIAHLGIVIRPVKGYGYLAQVEPE
jgi:DNA-binding response OmpR family regulator